MGGWYPPFFFIQKLLKPDGVGTELVRVSTEHTQGASLGGRRRENERTVRSFIRSLDGVTERT